MKKLLSAICITVLVGTFAQAQNISVGARGGLNFATATFSSSGVTVAPSTRTGIMLGGYATVMFTDNFGLQPELFYLGNGYTSGGVTTKLNYLSLPVLFRYNITEMFHLLAGPQLGVLMSAKQTGGGATVDIKDAVNSSDFGISTGLGLDFSKFNAGVRYYAGLSNISKASGETVKNHAFELVVGYKLFGTGK
jgi:hypothetical protein